MGSGVDWTDEPWSPIAGCDKVSAGCDRCYAEKLAHRFNGTPVWPNGFNVTLWPDRLKRPMRWRKPRLVFVCPTGDIFHHSVPDDFIAQVWAVMQSCAAHTFQVLTKRHARMHALLSSNDFWSSVEDHARILSVNGPRRRQYPPDFGRAHHGLPNVWLGVSVEDQKWARIRIPVLLSTPAFIRWVSVEPLLDGLDLTPFLGGAPKVDWVVAGGESGAGARPMLWDWARDIAVQCEQSGTAFFFKQTGSALAKELGHRGKGNDPAQWPERLPREFPQKAA